MNIVEYINILSLCSWKRLTHFCNAHFALFLLQYAILLTVVVMTFIKYVLHTVDIQSGNPWDQKAVYMLYTELVMGQYLPYDRWYNPFIIPFYWKLSSQLEQNLIWLWDSENFLELYSPPISLTDTVILFLLYFI